MVAVVMMYNWVFRVFADDNRHMGMVDQVVARTAQDGTPDLPHPSGARDDHVRLQFLGFGEEGMSCFTVDANYISFYLYDEINEVINVLEWISLMKIETFSSAN